MSIKWKFPIPLFNKAGLNNNQNWIKPTHVLFQVLRYFLHKFITATRSFGFCCLVVTVSYISGYHFPLLFGTSLNIIWRFLSLFFLHSRIHSFLFLKDQVMWKFLFALPLYMHICILYVCVYVFVYMYMYMCMYMCMYACVYICMRCLN